MNDSHKQQQNNTQEYCGLWDAVRQQNTQEGLVRRSTDLKKTTDSERSVWGMKAEQDADT